MPPRPATPSQVSYALSLLQQAVNGISSRRGPSFAPWMEASDAPTLAELQAMSDVEISGLIDSLKARKPFAVQRYGGGAFRLHTR